MAIYLTEGYLDPESLDANMLGVNLDDTARSRDEQDFSMRLSVLKMLILTKRTQGAVCLVGVRSCSDARILGTQISNIN